VQLRSIAFIPDGNRRYAKKVGIAYSEAYTQGFEVAKVLIQDWLRQYQNLGLREVTLWALSTENLQRNRSELEVIFNNMRDYLSRILKEGIDGKVRFIGRLSLLPLDIQELMMKVMEKTRSFEGYTINIAVAYGGRAEIIDAIKRLIGAGLEPTEDAIANNLYLRSEPDLIIRTGSTYRSSGFMLWQSAYSEWYFSNKLWPEFNKEELDNAINDYLARERRFGR